MSNLYRDALKSVSDGELHALFVEGEEWDRTGALPMDSRLRWIQNDVLSLDSPSPLHLTMLHHEVWREIAARSMELSGAPKPVSHRLRTVVHGSGSSYDVV